ncbi:MAG: hypothetical protein AB7V13_12760 [Pseudorhodoplanes sp.]
MKKNAPDPEIEHAVRRLLRGRHTKALLQLTEECAHIALSKRACQHSLSDPDSHVAEIGQQRLARMLEDTPREGADRTAGTDFIHVDIESQKAGRFRRLDAYSGMQNPGVYKYHRVVTQRKHMAIDQKKGIRSVELENDMSMRMRVLGYRTVQREQRDAAGAAKCDTWRRLSHSPERPCLVPQLSNKSDRRVTSRSCR